jgi:hypothetical protein
VNKNPRLMILLLDGIDFLRQIATRETRQNVKRNLTANTGSRRVAAIAGIKLSL